MTLKNYNSRMMLYKILSLVVFSIVAQQTLAVTSLPCKKSKFSEYGNLVEKISVIGSEDRRTFEAYAAEKGLPLAAVEKKFAATGVLNCDGRSVTAQLTGSNSVITTAAHFFVERKSSSRCKELPLTKCSFYTYKGGWTVEHPVDIESLKMSGCNIDSSKQDWAVIKLNRPAKGIKPYAIPAAPGQLKGGETVVNPVAFSDYRPNGDYTRSVIECSIRENIYITKTDCDSGPGASGSAQLIEENGALVQVAIVAGANNPNGGNQYDSENIFNISTSIDGEFYEALREAASKPARTASAKDKRDKGI